MNPRGHVQDWSVLKQTGIYSEPSALSPEICHDIVKDLHSPSGKGKGTTNSMLNIFSSALRIVVVQFL